MSFSIFPQKNGNFGGFYHPPGVPSRAPLRCFHVTRRWPVAAGPQRRCFAARSFWWRRGDRWRNAAAWWPRGWGWGGKNIILYLYCIIYTIFVYTYIHMGILYGTMENLLETMWEMILLMMQGMEWANRFSDHEKTWETHVYFNDGWWMVGMGLAELRDFKRQDWDVGEHCGRAWMMETRVPMTWDKMSSALIRWTYLWHCSQFPHIFLFFWFFDARSCTSPVFVNMFPHFSHDLSSVSGAFSPISPRGAPGHLHFADEAFRLRLLLGVFHVMSSGISPFNSHHSH